ncbi:MAG: hypothetical protein HY235_18215 [Acidobacteria bacterium]|nr:hypothetical protein [Acidobacteriota bacterium]
MKWLAGYVLLLPLWGQNFSHRGYLETRGYFFPQATPGDSSHAIGEAILRWEAFYKAGGNWRFSGGLDTRTDTHRQVEREARLDWQDRSLERPAFSLRRFSAAYHKGRFTAEFGKQFIRWGKADILNPTDRFAPKDFLEVINHDFLGVLAARAAYGTSSDSFELVYTPRFTPSRAPLFSQRWVILPPQSGVVRLLDAGSRFPGAGQFGARWNHVGKGCEFSASFFEGFNHLPSLDLAIRIAAVEFARVYPRLRFYGADAAVPLKWFTVKSEAGYYTSSDRRADEFLLYVIQLERQQGEWAFVGGYAGEFVSKQRNPFMFAPDRGIARTFLGRIGYTIDANRSVAVETALRQNGRGAYVKGEYSRAYGSHWRASAGFVLMRGRRDDFLGQYSRNSHLLLTLRYSF